MKRIVALIGAAFMAVSGSVGAQAGPGAHGFTSDDVEHVNYVPFEVGTSTGVTIKDDYMYLTSWKSISIYDITHPADPQLVGTPLPIGFQFENEDVNITPDGSYLIFSETLPDQTLHVYDIEDKENIVEVATLGEGAGDHTAECILKCKYIYGSDGVIVDFRDPVDPKRVAGKDGAPLDWRVLATGQAYSNHDVEEIKPGFVLDSPIDGPFRYIDVRNPVKPKVLAQGPKPDEGYLFHSGTWPRGGKDKFIVMQGEQNATQRCDDSNGPVLTYNTSKWQKTKTFQHIDTFRVTNGTYQDGSPAVNGLGCSAHWFETHPAWNNGGLIAMGYYEHGTRFFDVDGKGKITEVGWFLPHGGSTSAAYWAEEGKDASIVYAVDYTRGIDILKWNGKV